MNQDFGSYHALLRTTRGLWPTQWIRLFESFETLSLKERKAGILLFRAREIPVHPESTLYNLTAPFFSGLQQQFCEPIRELVSEIVENPDTCSIALSLLLSASYDQDEIQRIYQTMVHKEMSAMESEPKTPSVVWQNLLSLDKPLHPDFRPAPNVNRYFRGILNRWKLRLHDSLILPFFSTKSLSRQTLRNFNEATGNDFDSISPLQLEQYYSSTGIKIEGPCEMRQVWYPTISTPRTYYAMGGDAYFRSRYIRDIFNYLGDYLPATNRFTRVEPSHLTVESDEDVFVYDLTSFTSLFHEQRYFLDFIADIVEDVEVRILDTYRGIVSVSLADIIREYNQMNKQPEYSLERMGIDLTLRHSIAGFLGVYGNLITCTIPHGLCLMTLSDSLYKQWCAGDDAGTLAKKDDAHFDNDVLNLMLSIGSVQWEKLFKRDEKDAVVALKRQLIRLPNLLALQPNILFPPFSSLFQDDPRFERFHGDSVEDRVSRFCSGLSSMMYQMSKTTWSESEISYLKLLLPFIYKRIGLPVEGWFPPLCGYSYAPGRVRLAFTVPRILGDFWKVDPTQALLDAYMPRTFDGSVFSDSVWDGVVEDVFECRSSSLLSLASKLGYLEKEVVRVTYQLEEDVRVAVYREFLDSQNMSKYLLYRFTKLMDPPCWL